MTDRLHVLQQAVDQAAASVKNKASRENIEAYEAATAALERCRAGQGTAANPGLEFKTEAAAVDYLVRQGWQIGKSKFNADVNACLVAKRNGCFYPADLDRYAQAAGLSPRDIESPAAGTFKEQLQTEQVRKLRMENEIREGQYLPASEVEHMLAARAAVLKRDNEQFWRTSAAKIIRLVGGDETRAPELIELGLEETEDFFARYAEQDFAE